MKIQVTIEIDFPDEWVGDTDLTTSDNIISMLDSRGVLETLNTFEDCFNDAKIIT